ncbi:NADH:flavin oxidoreductase [Methylobacter sp. S3L5C]|uniref:NADH:flavin oxidoreductase n=1 Tax=Methylobacter sp. S3L5C TaxID=2839024 RepID=UPI001FACADA7|nr:NADH:flavin oxidoreductase [Methylobacter sp. S3L5C]UOA08101.1 NADH:flavin oxidoreductase [Methylobacter sp. S3L5C]
MTTPQNNSKQALFSSIQFGKSKLSNRIVMAPMTRNKSPNGIPTDKVVTYYQRRAEGGVGLIITEGTYIGHPAANGYAGVPAFHGEAALNGWKKVVDAVHEVGGKIIPQIWHVGAARQPGVEPDITVPGYGPMAVEKDGLEVVKAMSQQDIDDVVTAYAQAAADAERLGFDGVEVHGAHGYLIDQFLWEKTNQRHDRYGGSLENRLHFAVEVIRAVRSKVSADFPVTFRFSQWKLGDYDAKIAENPEELATILTALVNAGVDYFHPSTRKLFKPAFEGSTDSLAAWTSKLSGKPVIAVGSVGLEKEFRTGHFTREESPDSNTSVDVDALSKGIDQGSFDLVAVGRALLADPKWPNKVKKGHLDQLVSFNTKALDQLVI